MLTRDKRIGFTLAELMMVLLVVVIIIAAFAPIVTKRRIRAAKSSDSVWSWVQYAKPMNAVYDAGKDSKGSMFFGVGSRPSIQDLNSKYTPSSKVVVSTPEQASGTVEKPFFNFRNDNVFAGAWYMDGRNILLGSNFNNFIGSNTNFSDNVVLGRGALRFSTVRQKDNVDAGHNYAGSSTDYSSNNVAIGSGALVPVSDYNNPNFKDNVIVGLNNAYTSSTSTQYGKRFVNGSSGNVRIGAKGDDNQLRTVLNNDIAIGSAAHPKALSCPSGTGDCNYNNISVGQAVAYLTGYSGHDNIFIGNGAGYSSGNYINNNIGIGYNSLKNVKNTANSSNGLAQNNTAIGETSCQGVTSGSNKTCLGHSSTPRLASSKTDNIVRTYFSGVGNNSSDALLEIHNFTKEESSGMPRPKYLEMVGNDDVNNHGGVSTNTTVLVNGDLEVNGDIYLTHGTALYKLEKDSTTNRVMIQKSGLITKDQGSLGSLSNHVYEPYSSDRRLKNIKSQNNAGLDEISKLNVYKFNFKNDKTKSPQVGVIAQELQKVFPDAVTKGDDGYLKIRWDDMFFAVVNSIKQLNRKVIALAKNLVKTEDEITKLEKENKDLKNQVDLLTARVQKLKN